MTPTLRDRRWHSTFVGLVALAAVAVPRGAFAQCPAGYTYSSSRHQCLHASAPRRCSGGQHLSAGHCCEGGHEWVSSRSACICVDPVACGTAGMGSPISPTADLDTTYYAMSAAFESHDDANAERLAADLLARFATEAAATGMNVEARWVLAAVAQRAAHVASSVVHQRHLDVLAAFRASGAPVGTPSAYFAAASTFALADEDTSRALEVTFPTATADTPDELVARLRAAFQSFESSTTDPYVARMAAVEAFRVPEFFVASRVAQARAFEALLSATRDAIRSFDYSAAARRAARLSFSEQLQNRGLRGANARGTLERAMRELEDQGTLDDVGFQMQVMVETAYDEMSGGPSCAAVTRYMSAVRASRAERMAGEATLRAVERLAAYGSDQLMACAEGERRTDPTFELPQPDEFSRVPQRVEVTRWAPTLSSQIAREDP